MLVPRPAATVPGASRAHLPTTMTTEHVFPQALQAGDLAQATGGMTLRDYFAAQALPECLAQTSREIEKNGYCPDDWRYGVALDAYSMADAMLRARQQPTE